MNRPRAVLTVAAAACAALVLASAPALADHGPGAPAEAASSAGAKAKTTKGCKNPKKCTTKKTTTKTKSCKNPKKCETPTTTTSAPTSTSTTTSTSTSTSSTSSTTTTSSSTTTSTGPIPTPTLSDSSPATSTLVGLRAMGRIKDTGTQWLFSWPGVTIEGAFTGTSLGITLEDYSSEYDVQIDGRTVATLVKPGWGTHWLTGLPAGTHTARLVKRGEGPWATATFGGFAAGSGGTIIGTAPKAPTRQIEFIGDSFTAGYGDLSTSRTCGDQLNHLSNADITYGALTARALGADYQINAYSGRGMVRNYNGQEPTVDYRSFYDRALLADATDVWQRPSSWHPQVVVVFLGINDFSTALNAGEKWTSDAALVAAYRSAYQGFLTKLRSTYGPSTVIVATGTDIWTGTAMKDSVQQVVRTFNAAGDANVKYWYYADADLDHLGCDWHPSTADHQIIAAQLQSFLRSLSLGW